MGGDVISNGLKMMAKTVPDKANGQQVHRKLTISQDAIIIYILEDSRGPKTF